MRGENFKQTFLLYRHSSFSSLECRPVFQRETVSSVFLPSLGHRGTPERKQAQSAQRIPPASLLLENWDSARRKCLAYSQNKKERSRRRRGRGGKYIKLKLKTFLSYSIRKVKNQNQMSLTRRQKQEELGDTFSLVCIDLSSSDTCVSVCVCGSLKCVVTCEWCRH